MLGVSARTGMDTMCQKEARVPPDVVWALGRGSIISVKSHPAETEPPFIVRAWSKALSPQLSLNW